MENESRKGMLFGASGVLALTIAPPMKAAEDVEELEEVVVTGLRASLQRNLDFKREATGVVDVITSEEIGKFPDSNVAAALQRLPGVSIQRSGTRGEPTGVTVRGFSGDFNETLFDGRRITTAAGGRAIDFGTVGADFVGALQVMKTPDVTLSSSSIGATINVLYPKPFDQPGLRLVSGLSGSMQSRAEKVEPAAGVLFSNTFAEDTMGVLADILYTERSTDTNRVFVSGWEGGRFAPCQFTPSCTVAENAAENHTIIGWWQQQYGAEQSQVADKRIDGRIAFQWRPSDQMLLTIDDNYSHQKLVTDTYGFALWFGLNDLRNVTLDGNGTVVDFTQPGTPTDFNAGIATQVMETNQVGGNLKYEASENLAFDFDLSYAKSRMNPDGEGTDNADIGYGGTLGCDMGVRVVDGSRHAIPQMTAFGPACNEALVLEPSVIGSHVLVRTAQLNSDTIKQARFATTWKQEGLKLTGGLSYLDDNFKLENHNTFANNFWQTWSGYGPPSGRSTGLVVPASLFQGTINTPGFIPGFAGSETLHPSLLVYDARELYDFLEGLGNPQTQTIPGYNYDCCGTNYTGSLDLALDPGSVQDITEETWSLFIRADFETMLGSMPLHISAGLREEHTRISSSGIGRLPIMLTVNPSDPTLLTTTFSETQPINTKSSYAFMLPSLDMKLELTPEVNLRFNASRTLTRPAINFLTPVLNVGAIPRVGALTANGGNPRLKPYLADNFDLALEWYYQPNSYAAANGFVKDVSNFIVQGTQRQTINDVIDPTTGVPAIYTVSQRINGPEATVYGVELAWQHVFGDTGFGYALNGTLVDTNKPHDRHDISQSGFAVTGLANSANFVGFYDKSGFEARIAANWRDQYLLQFGQNQNNSAFGAEATYVNSSLQIDFSTSYQFTRQLNVFFEALNITNETQSTHGRFNNQMLDVFAYGRRYSIGARLRL